MELRIGDLLQCRENHYNRGLGIVGRLGMVAELRRKDIRILFDADHQSTWLPKSGVNRIALPPTDNPGLLDILTWMIRYLDATECELARDPKGNYQYTVVCEGLRLDQLHEVREHLGPILLDMQILPRGMHRLGLEVVFLKGRVVSGV